MSDRWGASINALLRPDSRPTGRTRSAFIDRARGLAVALMICDHALLIFGAPAVLRLGPTRAAMPIFAVLVGTLFRRFRWRWAGIGVVGLVFTVALPGLGTPNILIQLTVAAAVLELLPYAWTLPALVLCVTSWANFGLWMPAPGFAYPMLSVVALTLIGRLIPRSAWSWAKRLPAWLELLGRYPLTAYCLHVLALVTLRVVTR